MIAVADHFGRMSMVNLAHSVSGFRFPLPIGHLEFLASAERRRWFQRFLLHPGQHGYIGDVLLVQAATVLG